MTRILDLFCCAGGAGVGYSRAGFDVYGIDIEPQPDYPFAFYQGDALSFLSLHLNHDNARSVFNRPDGTHEWLSLSDFDAIHASPPCQASSALTKGTNKGREYIDLIPETRDLLERTALPYVIENVQGSSLRRDMTLCGEMFGLGVIRHRYFEVDGWYAPAVEHVPHRGRVAGWRHGTYYDGPYLAVYGEGGGKGSVAEWQDAMGIHWTDNRKSIAEAIPPAYTEFIGKHLMADLRSSVAAGG